MHSMPQTSFFMLWLNEQNPPFVSKAPSTISQTSEKPIESPFTSDNVCPPISLKNQESKDKDDSESLKLCKKNIGSFKEQKDPDYNLKKQKKNRNVLSNLVHHLMKYLSNEEATKQFVADAINVNSLHIHVDQFYRLLEELSQILKSYVTEKNLISLWKGELITSLQTDPQLATDFGKLMRILSRKFYKETCRASIFYSNKLSIESKELHYQGLHEIYELLFNREKLLQKDIKRSSRKC